MNKVNQKKFLAAAVILSVVLLIVVPVLQRYMLFEGAKAYGQSYIGRALCNELVFIYSANYFAQNCQSAALTSSGTAAETVINAAISALTTGGKIVIANGTYTFTTAPINLGGGNYAAIGSTSVSNIELYGEGNATVLMAGTNLNAVVIGVANVGGWYIHDLQVNGNRAQQSASGVSGIGLDGIWASTTGTNDETIEHCYIQNAKTYGIVIGGYNEQILNNRVVDSGANGIQVNPGSDDLIQGNIVNEAPQVGISLAGYTGEGPLAHTNCIGNIISNIGGGAKDWGVGIAIGDNGIATQIVVSNNQVTNATQGIESVGDGGNNTDIQISDNIVNSTTQYGIFGASTNTLSVEGNIVSDYSEYGMRFLTPETNVKVTDNSIHANITRGYGAIQVTVPYTLIQGNYVNDMIDVYGSGDSVIGNTVIASTSIGINLDEGCTHCSAIGNTVSDTTYGGITRAATDGMIANNQITANLGSAIIFFGSPPNYADYSEVVGNNVIGNRLNYWQNLGAAGNHTRIINNLGFNPIGRVANFVFSGGSGSEDGNFISPLGTMSTLTASTTYTVTTSPCTITFLTVGSTSISIDGGSSFTPPTGGSYTLQPGETINFGAFSSSPPTIQVSFG
jgi:hypothetical protein